MPDLNPLMKITDRGAERAKHLVEFGAEKLVPKGTLPYGAVPLSESEQWAKMGPAWLKETPDQKAQAAADLINQFPQGGADMFAKREAHFQRLAEKYGGQPSASPS